MTAPDIKTIEAPTPAPVAAPGALIPTRPTALEEAWRIVRKETAALAEPRGRLERATEAGRLASLRDAQATLEEQVNGLQGQHAHFSFEVERLEKSVGDLEARRANLVKEVVELEARKEELQMITTTFDLARASAAERDAASKALEAYNQLR